MLLYLLGFPRGELLRSADTAVPPASSGDERGDSVQRGLSEFEDEPMQQSIVTIAGKDRPGVMAQLLEAVLSVPHAQIDDLQEAGTNHRMLLVLLLSEPAAGNRAALKELLFVVANLPALSIRYEDVAPARRLRYLQLRGANPYAITVLGAALSFQFLSQMCRAIELSNAVRAVIHESRMLSDAGEPWQW